MKNRYVVAVLSVALAFLAPGSVLADGHTLTLQSTVSIPEKGQTSVKHVVSTRNTSETPLPAGVTFSVSGAEVSGVKAIDGDGKELSATLNQADHQIEVTIPKARRSQRGRWSFTLSYKSNVLKDYSSARAAQVTAVQTNMDVTKHTLVVKADLDLGFASVRGPKPAQTGIGVGQQVLTFVHNKGQIAASPLLLFGESTYADLTFNSTLENDSFWWKEVSLTLPPDTNQQKVLLHSVEPQPSNVRLDRDGNILAVYRLGPRQSVDVTVKMQIKLDIFDYKLSEAGSVSSTDQLLVDRYTRLTDHWQPVGIEVEADGSDAGKLVQSVFQAVVEQAKADTEDQKLHLANRGGALRYSDWLVGELRSRGVPSRVVVGLLSSDGHRLLDKPMAHAWAEVYVTGTGWVTLDPWLNVRTGGFAGSDPLHWAVGLWGIEEDRPPVVLDGISLAYSEEAVQVPPTSEGATLSATKHVWLPFVSTLNIQASMPSGSITDDVSVRVNNEDIPLGSLAPMQTSTLHFGRFGGAAFSSEPATLGLAGSEFELWQEVQSATSYTPLITISSILILALGFWWWHRHRQVGKYKTKPSKEALTLQTDAPGGNIESENLVTPAPDLAPPLSHERPVHRRVDRPVTSRPDPHQSATMKRNEDRLRSRQLIQ